jgi:hypothetical protein
MDTSRRVVVKGAALSGLGFAINGVEVTLSPGEARAQDVPLKILTTEQR